MSPSAGAEPTKAEFIAAGSQVCAAGYPDVIRLYRAAERAYRRKHPRTASRQLLRSQTTKSAVIGRVFGLARPNDFSLAVGMDNWEVTRETEKTPRLQLVQALRFGDPKKQLRRLDREAIALRKLTYTHSAQLGLTGCTPAELTIPVI